MTVFYRSPLVLVTHEVFEAGHTTRQYFHTSRQRYQITELRDVRVARGGPDRVAIGSTGLAGSAAVVVAACSPVIHSPQAWMAAVLLIAAPGLFGGACWRLNPPEWQLVASYHGYDVQLYTSSDTRTFNQVKRAVMRALEANG
jgi:hypothetical protein